MQFIIRQWKESTGNIEIDMHQVALYAHQYHGWPLPEPLSGIERLTKEFSQAAREETRQDGHTGRHYRVYHAFAPDGAGSQGILWIDIDEAPRNIMVKSARMRREQIVGDMTQLYLDLEHWNSVNTNQEPIVLVRDVTEDVDERLSGPDEAAA